MDFITNLLVTYFRRPPTSYVYYLIQNPDSRVDVSVATSVDIPEVQDLNHNGVRDESEAAMWEEILGNRHRHPWFMRQLHNNNPRTRITDGRYLPFEDPYEQTERIQREAARFRPSSPSDDVNEVEIALRIFRAVLQPGSSFQYDGQEHVATTGEDEGDNFNFNIRTDDNPIAPQRRRHGDLLPDEILAEQIDRVACCLEYSHLLVVLFREAGLTAQVVGEPDRSYVSVLLNGSAHMVDVTAAPNPVFSQGDSEGLLSERQSTARHYGEEGNILVEQRLFEQALVFYDIAIGLDPENIETLSNKANALTLMVADDLRSIRQINSPEGTSLSSNDDELLSRVEHRLNEAVILYDRVIALSRNDRDAWYRRGRIYENLASIAEKRSSILLRERHLNRALDNYDTIIEIIDSQHAPSYYRKGNTLVYLAQGTDGDVNNIFLEEAIANYTKASTLEPDHFDAIRNAGVVLQRMGRYEEAIASFERGLEIRPGDAELTDRISRSRELLEEGQLLLVGAGEDADGAEQNEEVSTDQGGSEGGCDACGAVGAIRSPGLINELSFALLGMSSIRELRWLLNLFR